MMNQHLERLDTLAPMLREPARALLAAVDKKLMRTLLVVYSFRSMDEQALLYQKGRTLNRESGLWEVSDAGLVVTQALPGTSAHNVVAADGSPASMALDVIPVHLDGTPDWNVGDTFWTLLYAMAWRYGFDPLGDPLGAYLKGDKGHLEEPNWKGKLSGLGLVRPVYGILDVSPSLTSKEQL